MASELSIKEMHGIKGKISVEFESKWGRKRVFEMDFPGVLPTMEKHYKDTTSAVIREDMEQYMSVRPCPVCKGQRLKPESLAVKIGGRNIAEITCDSLEKIHVFFDQLVLTDREALIARQILKEIRRRLQFLLDVGLNYLTLDRGAATLAGGEAQRIRLATQIGAGLMGVLYTSTNRASACTSGIIPDSSTRSFTCVILETQSSWWSTTRRPWRPPTGLSISALGQGSMVGMSSRRVCHPR